MASLVDREPEDTSMVRAHAPEGAAEGDFT
jgi:hypothetical protein